MLGSVWELRSLSCKLIALCKKRFLIRNRQRHVILFNLNSPNATPQKCRYEERAEIDKKNLSNRKKSSKKNGIVRMTRYAYLVAEVMSREVFFLIFLTNEQKIIKR